MPADEKRRYLAAAMIAREYLMSLDKIVTDRSFHDSGEEVIVMNKMVYFSSQDLFMTLDDFRETVIAPSLKDFHLSWDRSKYKIPPCIDKFTLVEPRGVDFSAYEGNRGLHVRVVRAFDITSDSFPCRVTVVYRRA